MIPFPGLPVDPAVAQGLVYRLLPGQRGDYAALLVRPSQTPGDVAWLVDNHARSASASATIDSSSSALAITAG
jgi:hypothetical protein